MADKKKIVLRRGPSIDLPGKPRAISPKQWNDSLDEGEMAFSADETRLFIGPNPESTLPQARRLEYPYRNIEAVGENSFDAFARMHGERMREGDNRDYHVSRLTPALAIIPTGYIIGTVIITMVSDSFAGRRLKVFITDNGASPIADPSGKSVRSETPARYWRVRYAETSVSSSIQLGQLLRIAELGFHETIGGPNIINQATIATVAGGTDTTGFYTAGDLPQYAVDGNPATQFVGLRPDFNLAYPLGFPPEGISFDFGAGNEKWITEASIIWTGITGESRSVVLEFSDDNINWTKAYKAVNFWPLPNQVRYLPERIEPIPHKKVRAVRVKASKNPAVSQIRLTDVTIHAVTDGPPLLIWSPTSSHANAYDGNILTEWTTSNANAVSAAFRFEKSTVAQVKVTGPLDPTLAPVTLEFAWSLDSAFDEFLESGGLDTTNRATFTGLTWTSREVKTFDILIPDDTTNEDAKQFPLV